MKVILSIKPEFAEKIFNGSKKFEFRRRLFKSRKVKAVIVYASAPISKIIGEFEIGSVLHDDLNTLWKRTNEYSGITEEYYLDYFKGKENGYAIAVKRVEKYDQPICIRQSYGLTPPQSFAYVQDK